MTKKQEERLLKLGYKTDLESLLDRFPEDIWLTKTEGTNYRRKPISFVITRHDKKWVLTLSTGSERNSEVYILHRLVGNDLRTTIGEMLLFMEDSRMLAPNI